MTVANQASAGPLGLPLWAWVAPLVALGLAGLKLLQVELPPLLLAPVLIVAMLSAVHYAEVIAHRIGEPYGTLVLVLALAVALVSLLLGVPLTLGLEPADVLLLILSLLLASLSLRTGRTTILNGVVHLIVFATYIFLVIVP